MKKQQNNLSNNKLTKYIKHKKPTKSNPSTSKASIDKPTNPTQKPFQQKYESNKQPQTKPTNTETQRKR